MAQGFTAISTSLGEAERVKNGKPWTEEDYIKHQKSYNIDPARTHLNTVLVSADGLSERDLVNRFMEPQMLAANQAQIDKVKKYNDEHSEPDPDKPGKRRMKMNPDKGKPYSKRSINKTRMFPVGDYKNKGTKQMPYDTYKSYIALGNARGKEADSTRVRFGVLQQFAVAWGNTEEWSEDPVRKWIRNGVNSGNPKREQEAKTKFEDKYVKPYMVRFQRENPSLHIMQAVVHYDETNPHLQITVMPHVDGKESGGLGSTSYTKAIKHDHPDMMPSKVIAEFYRQQHEELREQIKTVQPGLIDRHKNQVSMTLGNRPGTHKSKRVDQFKRMQEDNAKQMQWIADTTEDVRKARSKVEHDQAKADRKLKLSKDSSVTLIAGVDPDHRVPENLNGGVTGAPISSDKGRKEHKQQSANWLVETALEVAQKAMIRFQQVKELLDLREKEAKEREDKVKAREDSVSSRESALDGREAEASQVENDVADYVEIEGLKDVASVIRNHKYRHMQWKDGKPMTLANTMSRVVKQVVVDHKGPSLVREAEVKQRSQRPQPKSKQNDEPSL